MLFLHLSPDGVNVLRAARNRGVNAVRGKQILNGLYRFLNRLNALFSGFFERSGNFVISLGVRKAQRQILKFPLDLPDTEPVGERRVKRKRLGPVLAGGFALGVRCRKLAQRMKTRSKPQQHHAQIRAEREQKPADRIGLLADAGRTFSRARFFAYFHNLLEVGKQFGYFGSDVTRKPLLRILQLSPHVVEIGDGKQILVVADAAENIHDTFGVRHNGLACVQRLSFIKRFNQAPYFG
jgi:hypothetical protein